MSCELKSNKDMTCENKSTKKSPADGRGFKPNFSVSPEIIKN